jgi:hypothetical protein
VRGSGLPVRGREPRFQGGDRGSRAVGGSGAGGVGPRAWVGGSWARGPVGRGAAGSESGGPVLAVRSPVGPGGLGRVRGFVRATLEGGAVETRRHRSGSSATLPTGLSPPAGGGPGRRLVVSRPAGPGRHTRGQPTGGAWPTSPSPAERRGPDRRGRWPWTDGGLLACTGRQIGPASPAGPRTRPQQAGPRSGRWRDLGQRRGRPSLVRTWMRRTRPGPHSAPRRSSSLPWR